MQNQKSETIMNALTRAIQTAKDNSLQVAAQQLDASNASISDSESQFPPPGPFARSTW